MLRTALGSGAVVVRIGSEHEATALQPFSVVAASYGLPQRRLGTVSLVGPTRMDYEKAIATVRETAQSLSEPRGGAVRMIRLSLAPPATRKVTRG